MLRGRRPAALAPARRRGPTPPPSVQLCRRRRPLSPAPPSAARPPRRSQPCAPRGPRRAWLCRSGSARRGPGVPAAPLSPPRCAAGGPRARPSPVPIPRPRRPLPPRRGAPPGGRPWPRRAPPLPLPALRPPDWSAPGAPAAPAASSLLQAAAAAAAAAGTELPPPPYPPRTSGVNSCPAGRARSSGPRTEGAGLGGGEILGDPGEGLPSPSLRHLLLYPQPQETWNLERSFSPNP